MSQSYNYIKVKSRKQLQRENDDANLIINKAGTHSTMPGGTHMPIGRFTPEGVAMPGTYATTTANGDALTGSTRHTWTPSAGIGAGHVDSPPLEPRPPLEQNLLTGGIWDGSLSAKQKTLDIGEANRTGPGFIFDAANVMPHRSDAFAGALDSKYTEGSVGRDINTISRIKRERLKSRR